MEAALLAPACRRCALSFFLPTILGACPYCALPAGRCQSETLQSARRAALEERARESVPLD
jgi:hypothetical protein